MKLVVTEKNDAAEKIARLLSSSAPKKDKVFSTPVYRFEHQGEEWVTIGLRGHILEPNFTEQLTYTKKAGWSGVDASGNHLSVTLPKTLPVPPFNTRRKPFMPEGIDLKTWKMDALPYLVYAPIEKLPKEKDIIRSLKNLAKKCSSVIIATDFDREGELIGADALSCIYDVAPNVPVQRARYSSFTKAEIEESFSHLVELDNNLAAAGASRQDIDLIWGAVLTRYLTLVKFAGYGNVRSSGRVQTPTLALIVAKERERMAFVPEDYWVIQGEFGEENSTDAFSATHATARFKQQEAAQAAMQALEGATHGRVACVTRKKRTVAPPAPFNTTSLMAAASAEGISPARCMRLAESLYMDGYISYPRVDNTVYPSTLNLKDTVRAIAKNPAYTPFCEQLLKQPKLSATRGKQQTTDHPPIYPTALATPEMIDAPRYKLYNLIARRFLATLSSPAVIEGTKVDLTVNDQPFVAKGDVLRVPGFREIYPFGLKRDEQLPALHEGDTVVFRGATCTHKQTEPPARYSQGRLIQEMEKLGLGTKSTRHSIIERLYNVKYIVNDPIEPCSLGIAVCDALDKYAPHITHPEMTSQLEEEMNSIATGASTKQNVVSDSRSLLADQLEALLPHVEEVKEALADAVAADAYVGKCPKCGKDLQIRASQKTRSMFIGCAGWPDCDVTYPLPSGKIEAVDELCPLCGMPQVKVTAFRAKPRIVCIDPACASNKEPDVVVGECPVCKEQGKHAKLIAQRNPRTLKRFIRCENYDDCQTGYPLPQYGAITATDEVCEHCGAPLVIVTTTRGPWKLCPNFSCPSKETEEASTKKRTSSARKSARSQASKTGKATKATKTTAAKASKTAKTTTAKAGKAAKTTSRKK